MATVYGLSRISNSYRAVLRTSMLFALFALLHCGTNQVAVAQSVSVRVPVFHSAGSPRASQNVRVATGLNAQHKQWEEVLNQKSLSGFRGEMNAKELIERLRKNGLPVVLDQSAKDDSLTYDEPIELPVIDAPLRTRLLVSLREKNATITFRENHIDIISLDDCEDSSFMMAVVYDVTALNPNALGDIVYAIAPDSWADTGMGLATFVSYRLSGRELLLITQTYQNHREIQKLFNSMAWLTGTGARDWSVAGSPSVAVRVPINRHDSLSRQPSRLFRNGVRSRKSGGVF